jgi:hypothetical protein
MAKITLSEYEWQHDLLPAICAKCGEPAAERVPRRARFVAGRWSAVHNTGVVIGLLFFPPLFVLVAFVFASMISVGIPMCSIHQNDWKWRDRATYGLLFPTWLFSVVLFHAVAVVKVLGGEDPLPYCCAGPVGFFIVLIIDNYVIGFRAVKLAVPDRAHIKLAGVHPDFVEALMTDRARDRIDNPDRRSGQGDLQDDYDDEPV